ncbi:MAG: copper chaperone PCu(A)C [Spongiibacteraceae bacterium]|jgi:copper(I)-binding protein|nr:copper chaperone PCu(A)C [Spongiibacteraceae bacterium]
MQRNLLIGLWLALLTGNVGANESALSLRDGYVREMPPGHPVTAAFGRLDNSGSGPVELTGASCACAQRVEIHRHVEHEGRARMEQLETLPVPPGGVELAPGGLHLMLIDLTQPLRAGDEVELTLEDAAGGTHTVRLPVQRLSGVDGAGHHHH